MSGSTIVIPIAPGASNADIAAHLRRMADALDPFDPLRARPPAVTYNYHAPVVGGIDAATAEHIARISRFLTTGSPEESKADYLRRVASETR